MVVYQAFGNEICRCSCIYQDPDENAVNDCAQYEMYPVVSLNRCDSNVYFRAVCPTRVNQDVLGTQIVAMAYLMTCCASTKYCGGSLWIFSCTWLAFETQVSALVRAKLRQLTACVLDEYIAGATRVLFGLYICKCDRFYGGVWREGG